MHSAYACNSVATETVLLVDAFNLLNHQVALHNIRYLCPSLVTILINTYHKDANLFVDGPTLNSQEQVWYADDATGSMETLRTWWDDLVSYGPQYGYHVNASKTWLITNGEHHAEAAALFQDTSVNITTDGKPHLRAALGTKSYVDDFVQNRVLSWCKRPNLMPPMLLSQRE